VPDQLDTDRWMWHGMGQQRSSGVMESLHNQIPAQTNSIHLQKRHHQIPGHVHVRTLYHGGMQK